VFQPRIAERQIGPPGFLRQANRTLPYVVRSNVAYLY
jgi:hypothetical protein